MVFFFALTLSLFYSLAMAAFQAPFSAGSWWAFWALHFFHVATHALTFLLLGIVASLAVQAPLFLFVLVVNVTSALGTPELSSEFYRWHTGMPLYNAVAGSRTLLFGGFPRLGNNFGALVGWTVGFVVVYALLQTKMVQEGSAIEHIRPASSILELERKVSGGLRSSRQFSIRDDGSTHGSRRGSHSGTFDAEFRMATGPVDVARQSQASDTS